MKRLIIAASLVLVLLSCQKEAPSKSTFSTTVKVDSNYIKITRMNNFTIPYTGVRIDYTTDSIVKEVYLMVNSNDGHGWIQLQNTPYKGAYLVGGYYFKYFFHLILKDNSTFDTQTKVYQQ